MFLHFLKVCCCDLKKQFILRYFSYSNKLASMVSQSQRPGSELGPSHSLTSTSSLQLCLTDSLSSAGIPPTSRPQGRPHYFWPEVISN